MQKIQKGFTIIELIVVIAIIAVLATIVMINVTSYIAKGKDSAIKGNMASIQTIAATYYDEEATYVGLGSDASYAAAVAAITDADGTSIVDEFIAGGYCIEVVLNDTTSWCVDSTGYKGTTAECDVTTADCAADS
jgi:type IV pilus assembly protein PilA